MDKFTEEAFKKAISESDEARDAFKAWGGYAIPTFLTATDDIGNERMGKMVAALSKADLEDSFFSVCQMYFLAGYHCGRNEL